MNDRVKNVVLLTFLFLMVYYHAIAQQNPYNRSISIRFDNTTLIHALSTLSNKYSIKFSYNPDLIPLDKTINLNVENEPVQNIIEAICNQAGIRFELIEEQYILKPATSEQNNKISIQNKLVTLNGFIRDESTGEILIGSSVYVAELNTGTITNAYGFFSITVPEGNYHLRITYVGYYPDSLSINLTENKTVNIALRPGSELLNEIIIHSGRDPGNPQAAQMSVLGLDPVDLNKMPSFLGEGDVIKSLQLVPGIKLHGDGSTMFFVRGGQKDQNLILLDEAPIYNPSHLIGLFSTFIPDAIKDITIYKGDIPASYGGRLSSLIDIKTKEGNMKKFDLNGSFGLLSTKLSIESPIVRDKGSFFISARRSHIQSLFQMLNPRVNDFYFYDLNSKLNWRFSDKDHLFLSWYTGKDQYSEKAVNSSAGLRWNNNAITLRWNHLLSDRWFSNTTLYASNYNYYLYSSMEMDNFWNSNISNLTIKSDFSYYISPKTTLYTGISFSGHNINPGNFFTNGKKSNELPFVSQKHAREWAFYSEYDQKITPKLKIRYGLRMNAWDNTGEATEYRFDANKNPIDTLYYEPGKLYHQYMNLEPRLSINYRLLPGLALKASYNRTSQYLQLINNSISPFTSLDVWLPSGPNIPDQTAHQAGLGVVFDWQKPALQISLEGYYKKMNNQIDYMNHAEMLLNPLIESELRFGDAWSYGLELLIKKDVGRLHGWAGYSYSRVWKRTEGINNGRKYPAFYDRPHEICLYMTYDVSERFYASLNWYYSTGAAITTPSGFFFYQDHSVPVYTYKNNDRFPGYHRLDLSILFRLNKRPHRYQHQLGFSIFNLYGRKNPIFVNFNKIENNKQKLVIPSDFGNMPSLLTTHTYVYNVIPSITYYFKFR